MADSMGGVHPGWGYVPYSGDSGVCFLPALIPPACAGCVGRDGEHAWGCPVLIRLSAQLLAAHVVDWRDHALRLAAAEDDAYSAEARHWRAVREEPDTPAGLTPSLVPCDIGLRETYSADFVNFPGSDRVLERILASPMGAFLRSLKVTPASLCPVLLNPDNAP